MKTVEIKRNYKKDLIVNTIAQIFYLFVLWIMTIITPRLGNSVDAGVFTIALSVSNICTAIATYSISTYVATDINNKYNDRHYLYFAFTTTFISFVVSIVVSLAFGYHHDSVMFWAVILYYVFKCAENITITTTASMQRIGKLYIAGYALIIKAICSLAIFTTTLVVSKSIVLSFGLLAIFAFLYLFFVDLRLLKKYTNESFKLTKDIFKIAMTLFIVALPLFIYGEAFAAIVSFPRMVLGQNYSKEIVGYFGTMAAISTLIQSAVNAILIPFLPKITKYYNDRNSKDLIKLVLIFIAFVIFATGLAYLLACFLDKWVMNILYPTDPIALEYAHYFKWIILATGVQALVIVGCLSLVAIRSIIFVGVLSLCGLASMFIFSYLLIPTLGIMGVIYVYCIGYGTMLIASFSYLFYKNLRVGDNVCKQ